MSYFGRHREISARNASMPAASIFAHCAAVSRIERCSSFASGGVGGRPIGFLGCSMAIVYVIQKVLATRHLLNHNNYTPTEPDSTMNTFKIPTRSGILHAGRIVSVTLISKNLVEGVLSCGKPVGYPRVTLEDAGVNVAAIAQATQSQSTTKDTP